MTSDRIKYAKLTVAVDFSHKINKWLSPERNSKKGESRRAVPVTGFFARL